MVNVGQLRSGRRARVLFVGAFPPFDREVFGGQVTACRSLMQSTLPLRFDLDLIDSTQITNPPPTFPIRLVLALRRFERFVRAFERRRPDVVLMFVAVGMSLVEKGLMAWYARLRGVPALMSPRAAPSMYGEGGLRVTRALTRLAFGGVTGVICQSEAWRRFAISTLHFDESQTHVIANWTATPKLLAIGRARTWPKVGEPRLLFVGWVDKEKGVAELLDACRALRARFRFTLEIAGEGNYLSQAREFVRVHDMSETVRFHGWVQEPALHRLLAASDVLVLPSWAEGLPNAMIEAMAAGLAVVVTAVGGIPAVVTAGSNALVVPPRDPEALTTAIAGLLGDPAGLARIAAGGVRLASERFSVEPAVDLIEAAILGAIARAPARTREAIG